MLVVRRAHVQNGLEGQAGKLGFGAAVCGVSEKDPRDVVRAELCATDAPLQQGGQTEEDKPCVFRKTLPLTRFLPFVPGDL